jgi:hypothetical protein
MTTKLTIDRAAQLASEATASLVAFGRLGYSAAESLLGRAGRVSTDTRVLRAGCHQLALRAMSTAIRDAARDEVNRDRKSLLNSGASALEVLSRDQTLTASSARRW